MNCVNVKSKDFIGLLEETKLPSIILELRVAKFQDINGIDSFPTADDVLKEQAVFESKEDRVRDLYNTYSSWLEKGANTINEKYNLSNRYVSESEKSRLEHIYNNSTSRYEIVQLAKINPTDEIGTTYELKAVVKPSAYKEASIAAENAYNKESTDDNISVSEIVLNPESIPLVNSKTKDSQLNLFDKIFNSQDNTEKKLSKHELRMVYEIINRLSTISNIPYEVISKEEALKINGNEKSVAFFDETNQKAYIVEGNLDASTAFHEIFAHPFLSFIKNNKDYPGLYDNLLKKVKENKKLVAAIDNAYSDRDKLIRDDEYIAHAMENEFSDLVNTEGFSRSSLGWAIHDFLKSLTKFIKGLFGKNDDLVDEIGKDSSLRDIAMYAYYGESKLDLASGLRDNEDIKNALYNITLNKSKSVLLKAFREGNINYDTIASLGLDSRSNRFIMDYIDHYHPHSYDQLISGLISARTDIYDGNISINGDYIGVVNIDRNEYNKSEVIANGISIVEDQNESALIKSIVKSQDDGSTNKVVFDKNLFNHTKELLKYTYGDNRVYVNENGDPFVLTHETREINPTYFNKIPIDNSSVLYTPEQVVAKILTDLNAQLRTLERLDKGNVKYREKISKLIKDIQSEEAILATIRFVKHAVIEADKASIRIDKMSEQFYNNEPIDYNTLNALQRDFLGMYDKSLESISEMNLDISHAFDALTSREREALSADLDHAKKVFSNIKTKYEAFLFSAYNHELKSIASESGLGSITIDDALKNRFESSKDISVMAQFLGGMSYSKVEQLRILDSIIGDIEAKTNMEIAMSDNIVNLAKYAKQIKKGKLKLSFEDFMEKDDNGKRTGYLISTLKYGKYLMDLTNFQKSLAKEFGLKDIFSKPVDETERMKYNEKMNEFHAEHTERKFVKEYYTARNVLSPETVDQLQEASSRIKDFTDRFLDESGILDTEKMTNSDRERLFSLIKDRQYLSSLHYSDGSPKSGFDLKTAKEIRNFNEKTKGKLNYRAKSNLFDKKYTDLKNKVSKGEMTKEALDKWYKNNTKLTYDKSFYDQLATLERQEQTEQWNEVNDAKQAVLRMFRDEDTMEVRQDRLSANPKAFNFVKKADEYLDKHRIPNNKDDGKKKFKDIAEIETTEAYSREVSIQRRNKDGYAKWFFDNHYENKYGKTIPYSFWTKIVPVDKKLISIEPNSFWSELDKDSEYYNKNYDESLAENGLQPKRSIYDNDAKFKEVLSSEHNKKMYDALLETMKEANKAYDYIERPNNLRLPQMPTGMIHRLVRSNNIVKALVEEIKDAFITKPYDVEFGSTDDDKNYRADGSRLRFAPTGYRTMLDNPNNISSDLLHSVFLYYHKALSYKNKMNEIPRIELIMSGLERTSVKQERDPITGLFKSGDRRVMAGQTRMLKRAQTEVSRSIYGENMNKWAVPIGKNGAELNLTKPLMKIIELARKSNLSFNTFAIAANYVQGEVNMKIEATTGMYISNEDYARAAYECLKQMPETIAKSGSIRDNGRIVSLCRLFNVSRTNEKDFKGGTNTGISNLIGEKMFYGPYEAGDFMVKSKMLVALLMGTKYDPNTDAFYNRTQFLSKFYPKSEDRKDGITAFEALKGNMYDAIIIDKDGKMTYDKKYENAFTEHLMLHTYKEASRLAAKLDGVLTNSDRSVLHSNAIGQLLLMHRGWLVLSMQERFHGRQWSYEHEMMTEGQYRTAFKDIGRMSSAAVQDMVKSILGTYTGKLKDLVSQLNDSSNAYRKYSLLKTINEIKFIFLFSLASAFAYSKMDDDDEKNNTKLMFLYALLMRCAYEQNAVYSPQDLYGILQSPTAAQGFLDQIKELSGFVTNGEADKVMESGRYEGVPKWKVSLIKASPFRHLYESILHPDLKAKVKYMKPNVGYIYDISETAIGGELYEKHMKSQEIAKKRADAKAKMLDDIKNGRISTSDDE